jgi:two-component system NtrC family sensor kinase
MGTPFTEVILRGEDRLLEQILGYAEANGFFRFTQRNPETWRPAVRGVSGSIVQGFRSSPDPPSLATEELGKDDGLTAFVVVEARKYRLAGMPLGIFLGLGKIFRLSYDDLIRSERYATDEEARYRLFVQRFFDRNEIASCISWATESSVEQAEALIRKHEDLARFHTLVAAAKEQWEGAMDCIDDMLLLVDPHGRLIRCNRSFREFVGSPYVHILGRPCGSVLREAGLSADPAAGRAVDCFCERTGEWFTMTLYPCGNGSGEGDRTGGAVIAIHSAKAARNATRQLERKYELAAASLSELRQTQAEIVRREKAAAVGRLAAGVAGDIHPAIGRIASNLKTLGIYLGRIKRFLADQSACIEAGAPAALVETVRRTREQLKLDYVLRDLEELIGETLDGADSIRTVAADLKGFSRKETGGFPPADINQCLRDAVSSIRRELERKASLKADFGKLPEIRCAAREVAWAFRNLLLHAANAHETRGVVTLRTWREGGFVCVSIADAGQGIPDDRLDRIFDPYFSARETGGEEGLALSVASDIIAKHDGEIRVRSEPGEGTTFTVRLPVVEEV